MNTASPSPLPAGPVSLSREGKIALVILDNPPVNATSEVVRAGLMAAIELVDQDQSLEAALLICAGRTFIAGADITEFNKPPVAPLLPDVITRLEQATKPWITVIHGAALGGGLEVALGCHYRLADTTAKLGFPEVNLGLIPGAGGCVRLPRLIETRHAMTMIAGGKTIGAEQALDWGLVDLLLSPTAEESLQDQALAFARDILVKPLPQPLSKRPTSAPLSAGDLDVLIKETRKTAPGQLAPHEAIAAVQEATNTPASTALVRERERFTRLKQGDQSRALRYIFFAEKALLKKLKQQGITPLQISNQVVEKGVIGQRLLQAYNQEIRQLVQDGIPLPDQRREEQQDLVILSDLMAAAELNLLKALQVAGETLLADFPYLTPEDIDAVLVNCFAFPRWRGGPMYLRTPQEIA
ncbi:enoyl-CoA hydratase/isomerase family protein [Kiloniella laminariae]|uniref:Enoyl-CoA hydratase/isomerase family protein n=1 Tax=Kiloniella laminariae TaxID=454162 RepID=A0ABT4LNH4_9PROT|nr:enoyl-CoA hydratase/isomerase family protein [Kiloniella laminariae]MCZ4282697.1 enoyl-CoA hydratase/isomerase family protein [Kiloniella laminariae]